MISPTQNRMGDMFGEQSFMLQHFLFDLRQTLWLARCTGPECSPALM